MPNELNNFTDRSNSAAKSGIGADAHCSESGFYKTNAMNTKTENQIAEARAALETAVTAIRGAWLKLTACTPVNPERGYADLTVEINGQKDNTNPTLKFDVYFGEHLTARGESVDEFVDRISKIDVEHAKALKIARLESELEKLKGGAQ